ncbi:thiopeptide-type bacteriocin biosynthesis protein [Tenacibaculum finnmarkense]|uniref:thiopeptide-type bacteriocin biosynthesis protein n=1 Tax=Tenacibaculum finnmarkense TaxID=2781243 RepID=UPI001E28E7A7|nr:thiopeptide-type bacteriocin biosynthesis protein [Tenacibaculum finnmarkense]MCD8411506.1 thiopeptide-type bacteriocin biosynthesis protein [Tenacibaculum finnmarkense genomovar ulcerans]MCG8208272.1 thiopeptide-type bacteriocin biosynthesis protein [Tenacibaculum finnmarkense genomovar finnmarkense]MCG8724238.1 hypothetical protein [Tenacibaculum finnmarkense]MCG8742576.1 hypothetical protein [Tenacibaculum finnmarkense]MCG8765966.1 hypothetical protein [Tenacibaculum finnmarkense]
MLRKFIIGTEWLYYKVYTGVVTSDIILVEHLQPVITKLLKENIISEWFFIRYKDNDTHLRIRFKLVEIKDLGIVIEYFKNIFTPLLSNNLIHNVCVDTYNREIERYGINNIECSEKLFYYSSELVLWSISNEKEQDRWIYTIKIIDEFLNKFDYTLSEKKQLMSLMNDSFGREFNVDSYKRKVLSEKYKEKENRIADYIENLSEEDPFFFIFQKFKKDSEKNILTIKRNLGANIDDKHNYMFSLIHMQCNRCFRSKQRLNEWVVYNLMFQYYRGKLAREIKVYR